MCVFVLLYSITYCEKKFKIQIVNILFFTLIVGGLAATV